ncbi:MAG: hypothetical protein H0U49_00795 [Parachlamydiaceae bacterium]|nr:hypothetical protein [Parachlamydiaceae bacterium]
MFVTNSPYAPINDALGHVRALLDSEGNCVSTYRYSAFGEEQLQGDLLSPLELFRKTNGR